MKFVIFPDGCDTACIGLKAGIELGKVDIGSKAGVVLDHVDIGSKAGMVLDEADIGSKAGMFLDDVDIGSKAGMVLDEVDIGTRDGMVLDDTGLFLEAACSMRSRYRRTEMDSFTFLRFKPGIGFDTSGSKAGVGFDSSGSKAGIGFDTSGSKAGIFLTDNDPSISGTSASSSVPESDEDTEPRRDLSVFFNILEYPGHFNKCASNLW